MEALTIGLAIVVTAIGAYTDCRWRRVPNYLTFPAMAAGLICSFCTGWEIGVARVVLVLILFGFGALNLVGLGDLKLLMAIGALTGMLCLLFTIAIAEILLLLHQWALDHKNTAMDVRAGLFSILSRRFDSGYGTGRKVAFAPYILAGLIGGILICFVG